MCLALKGPRALLLQLACRKLSVGGNGEAREATQCGLIKYTGSPVRYPGVAFHCCALPSCLSFDNFLHLSEPQFPIYKVDLLILGLQGCWKESVLQTEVQTG